MQNNHENLKIYYDTPEIIFFKDFEKREIHKIVFLMLEKLFTHQRKIINLHIHFINDCHIAKLNFKYLACLGPTNVLSFEEKEGSFAQIYISLDTMEREAFFYGMSCKKYFIRLLAHGLCHASGLDHGEKLNYLSMLCENAASNKNEN